VTQWIKRRSGVHFLIVALFVAPLIGLLFSAGWVREKYDALEFASVDYRITLGRKAQVSPEIVFVAIDAASTATSLDTLLDAKTIADSRPLTLMHSSFPYPREVYALACDRLFAAGAKVVAIDVLFLGPSSSDDAWKSAIERYRDQLVVAMNFSDDPLQSGGSVTLNLPSVSLLPGQNPFDDRLGYINYWPDSDDVVRDAQYRTNLGYVNHNPGAERLPKLSSFAVRALQKGGHANLVPDDLAPRTLRFAGAPLKSFRNHSFYEIFDPHSWEDNLHHGEDFRDKIVLIGPQGDFVKDQLPTPYGLMNGAEIHLNAMNDLLQNEFLQRSSRTTTILLTLGAGLAAFLLALGIESIAWRFWAVVLTLIAYSCTLMVAYNVPGWLLPAVAPMGVFGGATGTGFVFDFVLAQFDRFRLRTTFERYNSKNVVKHLLDNTSSYKEMLTGTRLPVTVLFSDIRGFTTIAETADSQQLVNQLNEYFTAMVACVFRYDGSLDKFMGDGIMAIWGNTPYNFGPKEDAVRAVRAALAMLVELRRLNAKWLAEGRDEWRIGIGLNHGLVIVGDMGSQQHKEFAVVGDPINLGSRLEGLTKEYHLQILLGEGVAELVRDQFHLRSVDIVQVKGKTKAVQAYTVLGEKSEALSSEQQKLLALYEEGISSFRRREFVAAKELFAQALRVQPDDYLTSVYLTSCEEFIQMPPGASWTGVRVMTEK
jgi:adenylate cyclase